MAIPASKKPTTTKPAGAQPAGRRGAGRPSNSEAQVGREVLITTTCELLSKAPADQVTRALVARTLNVDPSLIRYYFRDRASLLAAAAERVSEEYSATLEEALKHCDGSAKSRIAIRLGTLIDFNAKYPFFHHLIYNELLHSDSPDAERMIQKLNGRAVGGYAEILEQGAAAGELRAADPELVFIAFMTMSSFFTPLLSLLGLSDREDFDSKAFSERYKAFLLDFVADGLSVHKDGKGK